ncbi:hypothetical protein DRW03_14935 [Corallococcus sp. H22C18031201]|uniref:hypothetical protein n=1 Tax=Citreicoccus inhibens TaxID=2849499 RepID=UPI000E7725CF|nr:hypothetical protein [Citreicoccus inhibens]MBU8895360.1 hypothetical protein [Citreicoccus inhibens]RJS22597.1 hypothetical protein DRW03_14935 [Corallococcus sp. H22C18031201]
MSPSRWMPLVTLLTSAALLPGCFGSRAANSNPKFLTDGHWSALDSPYALTPMLICAYSAQGNDKVNRAVQDYVGPALWTAYGQDSSGAKFKTLAGTNEWCETIPRIGLDNFIVPPRVQKELAEYVKRSGAKGVIIPMALVLRTEVEKEIRAADGSTIAVVDTDQFRATGIAEFSVHYINEQGELVHTRRAMSRGYTWLEENLKTMRDEAPTLAQELLKGAPPVTLP